MKFDTARNQFPSSSPPPRPRRGSSPFILSFRYTHPIGRHTNKENDNKFWPFSLFMSSRSRFNAEFKSTLRFFFFAFLPFQQYIWSSLIQRVRPDVFLVTISGHREYLPSLFRSFPVNKIINRQQPHFKAKLTFLQEIMKFLLIQ